jgi:hypothetical protein
MVESWWSVAFDGVRETAAEVKGSGEADGEAKGLGMWEPSEPGTRAGAAAASKERRGKNVSLYCGFDGYKPGDSKRILDFV